MTEQTDWWGKKQPSQVACVSEKSGVEELETLPAITKPSLDEKGVERGSVRRSIFFEGTRACHRRHAGRESWNCFRASNGETSERRRSTYGLFRARRYS